MAGYGTRTDHDSAFADSGTDATVKEHQIEHDRFATITNLFDKDLPRYEGQIPSWDSASGLYRPEAGFKRTGNRWAFIGDSQVDNFGSPAQIPWEATVDNFTSQFVVRSNGQIQWGRTWGGAGDTLAQIRSTVLPLMLSDSAYNLPNKCMIIGGTNDIGGAGWTLLGSTSRADMAGICGDLEAAGVVPVLGLLCPRNDAASPKIPSWNHWLTWFAQQRGYPLMDLYSSVVDPATGQFLSAMTIDGVHISALGNATIAKAMIAAGNWGSPWKLFRAKVASDSISAVTNQINTASTSGLATGWSKSAATYTTTIVAPVTADDLAGNWQQVAIPTGIGFQYMQYSLPSHASLGWAQGDILALTMRVQVTGTTGSGMTSSGSPGNIQFRFVQRDAGFAQIDATSFGTSQDIDGTIYLERPIIALSASNMISIEWPTSTSALTIKFGEISVRNLTQLGQ